MKTVTKRSGSLEPFDIDKIRVVIQRACDDLDVNPLELESTVNTNVVDKTETRYLQGSLIDYALSFANIDNPDWLLVAGRLFMQQYRKDTIRARGIEYNQEQFPVYLQTQVDKGIYDSDLLKVYTSEQIKEIASVLEPERDQDYNIGAATALVKKYMCPDELPQEAFLVAAMTLHKNTRDVKAVKRSYNRLSKRELSLATPSLIGLRKPDSSLSSCFILDMEDNLESIFRLITNIAKISKNNGGVGINASRIRALGSSFQGVPGKSKGVLPFIKIINDTMVAIDQGGKRAGAATVALAIWHADLLDFLECQRETGGDLRMKSFDIFPQLLINDLFMEYLIYNMKLRKENPEAEVDQYKYWYLVCPHEVEQVTNVSICDLFGEAFSRFYEDTVIPLCESGQLKVCKKINPIQIIKEVITNYIETGLPYITFIDEVNRMNPNKDDGKIHALNLCVESYSSFKADSTAHCCNLMHINLSNVEDFDHLKQLSKECVYDLDTLIDLTRPPIPEAKAHNNRYRTIGQCTIGLADWLAKNNYNYYTGRDFIKETMEVVALGAVEASIELAKEKGTFEAYENSEWAKGRILNKDLQWFRDNAKYPEEWERLHGELLNYGIRNSELSCIAPNTSSSLVQGCSASFLPVYQKFFADYSSKGSIPQAAKFLKDKFMYYTENLNFPQENLIDIVGEDIQPWLTAGISMELSFKKYDSEGNIAIKTSDLYNCIVRAWEKKCKAIYYIRTNDNRKEECTSCAG